MGTGTYTSGDERDSSCWKRQILSTREQNRRTAYHPVLVLGAAVVMVGAVAANALAFFPLLTELVGNCKRIGRRMEGKCRR